MILRGDAQQARAQQGAGREGKGCGGLLLHPEPDDGLQGAVAQLFSRQNGARRGLDDLQQGARLLPEDGAQTGMALQQGVERLGEGLRIQVAAQTPQPGEVIGRHARQQLVQEPEALLREGGVVGQAAGGHSHPGARGGRRQREQRAVLEFRRGRQGAGQPLGLLGDGGLLEDPNQRDLPAALLGEAQHQPGRGQGVAAHQKEVVVDAEVAMAQHLSPEGVQRALARIAGQRLPLRGRCPPGSGQGRLIELAVGGQGQGRHGHDVARHHHLRQALLQEGAQRLGRWGCLHTGGRHHIGHQGRQPPRRPPEAHRGLGHVGMVAQQGLDRGRLHAHAPQLDLAIAPPVERQGAIGAPAHQIARAVEPRRGVASLGIGPESPRTQLRLMAVAERQAGPPDMQLAGHPDRCAIPLIIKHAQPAIRQGNPDRHVAVADLRHDGVGGDHVGFGRAVVVVELELGRLAEEAPDRLAQHQPVAGHDHIPQGRGWNGRRQGG